MPDVLWKLKDVDLPGRLQNVSLDLNAGITSVVGYSGAGKTSLLNVLAGMETEHLGGR